MTTTAQLPQVPLGQQGLMVSAQGLGCMSMTGVYGDSESEEGVAESLAVIDKALELGVNCRDTAEAYGPYRNEELIGEVKQNSSR